MRSWKRWWHRESTVPLRAPRLDGSTWPGHDPGARSGFEAATTHRLGLDAAFTPEAHDVADLVVARLVPHLDFAASVDDLPHTIDLLRSATRIGAGLGLVDARRRPGRDRMRAEVAGALVEAEHDLPPLTPPLARLVRYLLHAGHHVARLGPETVDLLEADLTESIPD